MKTQIVPEINTECEAIAHDGKRHLDDTFFLALMHIMFGADVTRMSRDSAVSGLKCPRITGDMKMIFDLPAFVPNDLSFYKTMIHIDHHQFGDLDTDPKTCTFGWLVLWLWINRKLAVTPDLVDLLDVVTQGDNQTFRDERSRLIYEVIRFCVIHENDDGYLNPNGTAIIRKVLERKPQGTIGLKDALGINKNIYINNSFDSLGYLNPYNPERLTADLRHDDDEWDLVWDVWTHGNVRKGAALVTEFVDHLTKTFPGFTPTVMPLRPAYHYKIVMLRVQPLPKVLKLETQFEAHAWGFTSFGLTWMNYMLNELISNYQAFNLGVILSGYRTVLREACNPICSDSVKKIEEWGMGSLIRDIHGIWKHPFLGPRSETNILRQEADFIDELLDEQEEDEFADEQDEDEESEDEEQK